MAVAFGLVATNTASTGAGTTLTITKPTGLASGDLMIALLNLSANTSAWTATGWTQKFNQASGAPAITLTCLVKVADSSDASATDFTFTNGGSSDASKTGILFRITGTEFAGAGNITHDVDVVTSDTTPSYPGGVTPSVTSALLIMGAGTGGVDTFSTYAVTNSDPTWTERADINVNSTNDCSLSAATATYSVASTTGAYSLAISVSSDSIGYIMAIVESADVTVTLDTPSIEIAPQAPTITGDANLTLDLATIEIAPQPPTVTGGTSKWNNTDKSAAPTWNNTDKS